MTQTTKKQNYTLILLIVIFFGPMLAAWLAYSKGIFISKNKVNHGVLLTPPLALSNLLSIDYEQQRDASLLKGHWLLMYVTEEPENKVSLKALYYMRQIRQATGKYRDRIERAIVSNNSSHQFNDWLKTHFPGTQHFMISNQNLQKFKASLPKKLALDKGSLYLVDPLGNIILFYNSDAPPKGILKDLQRVLKVSQIG